MTAEFTPEQIALAQQAAARLCPDLVQHGKDAYLFEGPCNPVAEFIDTRPQKAGARGVDVEYKCTGSHIGPPIHVIVVGADRETDGDDDGNVTFEADYDRIEWADDRTECDRNGLLLEDYGEAIYDDLKDWLWRN
jgi:hypothetical protein